MKKLFLIVFFFINSLIINISNSSEIIKYPLPEITNYPPSINGGQTQTWDITQGKDGKLYFANSYGLLIYDGKREGIMESRLNIEFKTQKLRGFLVDFCITSD